MINESSVKIKNDSNSLNSRCKEADIALIEYVTLSIFICV